MDGEESEERERERKNKEKKRDGSNECQKGTFRMKRVKFNKQTNTQNYTTKYNYKMEVSNAHTHAHTCKMYLFYMHAHKTHVETLFNIRMLYLLFGYMSKLHHAYRLEVLDRPNSFAATKLAKAKEGWPLVR